MVIGRLRLAWDMLESTEVGYCTQTVVDGPAAATVV